jgi:hypothetical protein
VAALQPANQLGRLYLAHLQGARHAKEFVPLLGDEIALDLIPRYAIESAVMGSPIDAPHPDIS